MSGDKNKPEIGDTSSLFRRWLYAGTARVLPLALAGLVMANPASAQPDVNATPQGGVVVGGSATFNRPAVNSLIVNQKSNRAVINWNSFNVGSNAKTEFKQPNANSIAVNRVVGGIDPTQIMGSLKSNGQLVVLDPNGVVFGAGSRVDVGGLVASTGSMNTTAFMNGSNKITLSGMTTGTVENQGSITVREGGLAALVAPTVKNSGVIQANMGRIELASGSAVTLDFYGDQMVSVAVSGAAAETFLENSGVLQADGGRVAMTAKAAQGVVDGLVNMSGVARARSISGEEGRIVLTGGDDSTVTVTGNIDVSSGNSTAGYVEVTGETVVLQGADINASARKGGGEVYIGGGWNGDTRVVKDRADATHVSADSNINVNATRDGNGGTVVVWSDGETEFFGNITARGGSKSGNGGNVEVSTGDGVVFEGHVDTRANHGKMGLLLIDPATVTIGNSPDNAPTYLNAAILSDTLFTTNVTVQADDNIDIFDAIDLENSSFGRTAGDLTLSTSVINLQNDILFGDGDVNLNASTVLNLGAKITSSGALLGASRLRGTAPQVNVLNSNASIQQALDASSTTAPVVVNVASGQYHGNLLITHANTTLRGNVGTTAVGADATAPEIFGTQAGSDLIFVSANGITIEGFKLNAQVAGGALADSQSGIIGVGNNATIRENTFTGFDNAGISHFFSTNMNIENNFFTGIGLDAVSYISGNDIRVANNLIEGDGVGNVGAGRYGIYVVDSQNVQILNNTIRGKNGGIGAGDTAIYALNNDGIVISNNLIEGLAGGTGAVTTGIYLTQSDNATVTNNTVHSDGQAGSVGVGGAAFDINDGTNANMTAVNNQVVTDGSGGGGGGGGDPFANNPHVLKIEGRISDIAEDIAKLQIKLANTTNAKKRAKIEKQIDHLENKSAHLEQRIVEVKAHLAQRVAALEHHIQVLETKLANTTNPHRQQKIQKEINRLENRVDEIKGN